MRAREGQGHMHRLVILAYVYSLSSMFRLFGIGGWTISSVFRLSGIAGGNSNSNDVDNVDVSKVCDYNYANNKMGDKIL